MVTRFELYEEVRELLEKDPEAFSKYKYHKFFTEEFKQVI